MPEGNELLVDGAKLDRFYVQTVVTSHGTVLKRWNILDRETSGSIVLTIYRRNEIVEPVLKLLNENNGYLD